MATGLFGFLQVAHGKAGGPKVMKENV